MTVTEAAPAIDLRARLATRKLLVITGKGGVGKTVVAATLGRLLAEREGLGRVLVLEVDPRENLHQMLDLPPSGGDVAAAGGGVFLQNLKPRQVLDRVVGERLKIEALARRVLSSPVYQNFAEGAPGLKEVAILGHALRLVRGLDPDSRGEPFDLVILDAPATGHGVSLLTAPLLISEVIQEGPFGRMGGELAEFVADPSLCGVVVVTSAEEMPVHEALELEERLQERLGRGAELMVVNGLYPPLAKKAAGDADGDDPALDLWAHRRHLQEREMARLEAAWSGPLVELPKLPLASGPRLVASLVECLARGLQAAEED
jgi:anion-transporting  ArsA/GET3 family ATPase